MFEAEVWPVVEPAWADLCSRTAAPAELVERQEEVDGFYNLRLSPLALRRLLASRPALPHPAEPPPVSADGNLGSLRARLVSHCLGRLGAQRGARLGAALGVYADPWSMLRTPEGQPVRLFEPSPLEALERLRRLSALAGAEDDRVEGLERQERRLLVGLARFGPTLARRRVQPLAVYTEELAARSDDFHRRSRILDDGTRVALARAALRYLEAACDLLGLASIIVA